MTFPVYEQLKQTAKSRMQEARDIKKIAALYTGLTVAVELAVFLFSYFMDLQIGKTGGLANMGLRTVLSTVQSVLPIAQLLFIVCLDFGFLAAALRIARGQFCSVRTLKTGLDRLWPLLKLRILTGAVAAGTAIASFYLAATLYTVSPLSKRLTALLSAMLESGKNLSVETLMADPAVFETVERAVVPIGVIAAAVFAVLSVLILFRYRLASYVMIDNPGSPALFCLITSRRMMRGNRLKLLLLDLRMGWYYAAMLLSVVVGYGDIIAPMAGIALPGTDTVLYFGFYILYLLAKAAVLYFLRIYVMTVYGALYDSLCPKAEPSGGVVLGNIFQMG